MHMKCRGKRVMHLSHIWGGVCMSVSMCVLLINFEASLLNILGDPETP